MDGKKSQGNKRVTKAALRREALRRRDGLSPEEILDKSQRIARRVMELPQWKRAAVVLGYYSFGSEVRTEPLLEAALEAGKRVVLPRVNRDSRDLELFYVPRLGEPYIAPGTWGIPEPVPEECEPAAVDDVDLVIVPGVAFDERGGRLGYGGGFYDRLLGRLRPDQAAVALAFEAQLVEAVPVGELDRRVPVIVTEQRVIHAECERVNDWRDSQKRGQEQDE